MPHRPAGAQQTQSQPPTVPKRSQRQRKQTPRHRGEHEALQATILVVQEVKCGEHELGRGTNDDDPQFRQETEFGQETLVHCNALELFDYGNVRPLSPSLSPSPRSPSLAQLSLQHIVEDDVSGGGIAPVGAVYRG